MRIHTIMNIFIKKVDLERSLFERSRIFIIFKKNIPLIL